MTPSHRMNRHLHHQSGAIAIEYALVAAFVAATVLSFFGTGISDIFSAIWQKIFHGIA